MLTPQYFLSTGFQRVMVTGAKLKLGPSGVRSARVCFSQFVSSLLG